MSRKDGIHIHGLGTGDFLDEGTSGPELKKIRSRKGSVSPRHGRRRSPRASPLEAEPVCDVSGRLGWRVHLPGGRPLATPAVAGGRVFVGGGFGSHEFYAFSAPEGRLAWQLRTGDDGSTAATVAGSYVAFNTESCTVYVADARTGRVLWERWLGDPLMAQTAISGSRLFMVFPDRARRHQLAAFELPTGREEWRTELVADVLSAPILSGGSVYAATLDGTAYRIDAETGRVEWSAAHGATSAPWIHRDRVYMSLREEEEDPGGERFATEGFDTVTTSMGARKAGKARSRRKADYLRFDAGKQAKQYGAQDASVGFGTAPAAAKLHMAAAQIGVAHVASLWAYQGSRLEVFDDGIFGVLDDVVQRLDLESKKPLWRVQLEAEGEKGAARTLSPPAVTEGRLYVTSSLGDLFVVDRATGEELWSLNVGAPILAQPAVAEGKVFVGTAGGTLYAFEADDPSGAGWTMWGGGPGHNGPTP